MSINEVAPRNAPRGPASRSARAHRPCAISAFTLMEILVAMAVLSITLLTLYESFVSTVHINTMTQGLWKAIVFANNELSRIERGPIPDVSIQQGSYQDDHPMAGYDWRREVLDEEPFPGVKVRKVLLELRWAVGGSPQTYRAEIYVPPQ